MNKTEIANWAKRENEISDLVEELFQADYNDDEVASDVLVAKLEKLGCIVEVADNGFHSISR